MAAAFRLQFALARRSPAQFYVLASTPLLAAMLISLDLHAGRRDLLVNAIIAPALIGLWLVSLDLAGSMVEADRWEGRLEPLLAAPAALALVIFGRIAVVASVGVLAFGECWLLARLAFGVDVTISHPLIFAAGAAATAIAMAGTATLLSAVFVLGRSTVVLQNSLSYPFYILGGVMVPAALLPGWLHPLSRVIFLSWSADLLRAAAAPPPVRGVLTSLGAVLGLGAVTLAAGVILVERVARRVRRQGTGVYA
jgi:ABC-2 type transport system permease protein